MVPGPDYDTANRRKASITARAASFTVLPVSGGRLRQADLFQGPTRSGNAALRLSAAVLQQRRR